MMTLTQPIPRPAEVSRRRLTWPGIVCALAALISGCAEAPITKKYEAKAWLQKARDAGAGSLAPEPLLSAEGSYEAGVREVNKQLQETQWNRSYDRAEAMLDAAIRRAKLAEARARRHKDEARDRTQVLLARADSGFNQMAWLSSYIPPRSPIRADVSRARVNYAEARSLFDEGQYARAAAAAQRANAGIDAAHTRFSRFIHSAANPGRRAQYADWVQDTISWSAANNGTAIIVDKMRRTLLLIVDGRRVRTYAVELGINGTLTKVVAGDRATPEGKYKITEKRGLRQTRWHKALLLNYPNEEDLKRFKQARRRGQISRRAGPGSLIEIHGEGGRGEDWTDGCVALGNRDMDDLFGRVSVGTPVTIVGAETDGSGGYAERRWRKTAPGRAALAGAGGGPGAIP